MDGASRRSPARLHALKVMTMPRSIARRLALLERATAPDTPERLMITIVVNNETPDRIVRTVDVPLGIPGGALDYRNIAWYLRSASDAGDDHVDDV